MKQFHVNIFIALLLFLTLILYFDNKNLSEEIISQKNVIERLTQLKSLKHKNQKIITETSHEEPKEQSNNVVEGLKKNLLGQSTENSSPNVKIYDLTNELPSRLNDIRCKKSARIHDTQTTLCVHDIHKDVHVSGSIWSSGVWEREIITSFLQYVGTNPDWLVLDFGAQIGQYSLFPAEMGRKVLTVEPFYENIKRIHKAAMQEKIGANIKLVQNAISNKRNEIKLLAKNDNNIGGQSLVHTKTYTKQEMASNPYLVETILMNDLVDQIPLRSDGQKFKSAILKIDIEGSEPFAFEHADMFFDTLDIQVIFMEWGNLPKINQNKKIENMIEFLTERSYVPYVGSQKLQKSNWMKWPWDIVWKKRIG